jgi:hypothetical protein
VAGVGEKNAARRILEWPESQQQLRDEKLISHQLPNNRVGAKVSVREDAGCRYLMLTIARSFKELLS